MGDRNGQENQDLPLLQAEDLEPHAAALHHLLRAYALQQRRAQFDFPDFAGFVKGSIARHLLRFPLLDDFNQRTEAQVATYLRALADRELCRLEPAGQEIKTIHYPDFFREIIRLAYHQVEQRPEEPFPNEKGLGIIIPPQLAMEVNIKTEFVNILASPPKDAPDILRLAFPESIDELLVTAELVQKKLLELALSKMRNYLNSRNNAAYAMHRLLPALRGNEHVLRDMIDSIVTKSSRAISSLTEPSDFSFRFWAHFANLIIQEYKERSDKNPEEHGYCQSAYLVGYYNAYYRNLSQKESEKTSLLRRFDTQFHKAPYAYTLKDIYGLRDEKGLPLVRSGTNDVFLQFLENKTRMEGYKSLPDLVLLKTVANQEYYLHKDLLIPFFLKRLYERRQEIRDHYIDAWEKTMKEGRRMLAMSDDQEFLRDLEITVKGRDPLLHSLLNFNLLFLAREETNISYEMTKELDRCLDEKQGRLKPLSQILDLSRKGLLEDARLRVPVWQRFALLKGLLNLIQDLLRRFRRGLEASKKRRPKAQAAKQPAASLAAAYQRGAEEAEGRESEGAAGAGALTAQQLAAYKKAVQELKNHFVGPEKTIPQRLGELAEKWNPLYDSKTRTDLVEDVNSMIRDYLRSLKRGFRVRPPDAERIRALAEKLSENKGFERITRKDLFRRYIEVYMIKILSER